MGHHVSAFFSSLGRFFEYPVKRKPICFYRQEDFTATGEPKRQLSEIQKFPMTDYDKLVELFYRRLAEQRQYNQILQIDQVSISYRCYDIHRQNRMQVFYLGALSNCHPFILIRDFNKIEMKEQDRRWSMQKVVEKFPGWNEVTIANLHSLFLLFDNQSNGMLGYDDFCAVLESLGDETSMENRKEKFNEADTDNDGWVTYDEFLTLVYTFSPQEDGQLTGLAQLCNDVADNIQFVSNLSVGEQLEYGLF